MIMAEKEFTFIRITVESKRKLDSLKVHPKQPYSEVVEQLLKKLEKLEKKQ
jgi:hypothetical protein